MGAKQLLGDDALQQALSRITAGSLSVSTDYSGIGSCEESMRHLVLGARAVSVHEPTAQTCASSQIVQSVLSTDETVRPVQATDPLSEERNDCKDVIQTVRPVQSTDPLSEERSDCKDMIPKVDGKNIVGSGVVSGGKNCVRFLRSGDLSPKCRSILMQHRSTGSACIHGDILERCPKPLFSKLTKMRQKHLAALAKKQQQGGRGKSELTQEIGRGFLQEAGKPPYYCSCFV